MLYVGAITRQRGIERLMEVTALDSDLGLVLLGHAALPEYKKALESRARDLNVADRVLFYGAVPHNEMWKCMGAADVNMIIIDSDAPSYYHSLPNKFFESIQAEVPLIVSDLPEMGKIMKHYGIGILCDSTKPEDVCACVERMRTDKEFYQKCKVGLKEAKEELCWENEKSVLENAYASIL